MHGCELHWHREGVLGRISGVFGRYDLSFPRVVRGDEFGFCGTISEESEFIIVFTCSNGNHKKNVT